MIDGEKHLQDAFKGHSNDALHPCHKGLHILFGHISLKSQLPKLLLTFSDLSCGTDDNFCLPGVDNAILVKMPCGHIAYMGMYSENLISVNDHGVLGQL